MNPVRKFHLEEKEERFKSPSFFLRILLLVFFIATPFLFGSFEITDVVLKIIIFSALVASYDVILVSSVLASFNGTLGTNIDVYVNGAYNTSIHTSCSQPIYPGMVVPPVGGAGGFTVLSGYSKQGGLLCPLVTE